jgi:PAS domain S-box-containing protein
MDAFPHNIPEPLRALDILENVSDAVFAFDRDWRFVYANTSGIAMARLPKEQLIGGELWTAFPEVAAAPVADGLRATLADGAHRRFEYFHVPYDLWVEIDAYATPGGVAIFVRDISHRKKKDSDREALYAALRTEQERLRVSEERFRLALKNSPVAVFNQDCNLTYTWLYNTLEGYRDVDWVGRNDIELGEAMAPLVELKLTVLKTGQSLQRAVAVPNRGDTRFLDFHLEPIRNDEGAIVGLAGAVTDTTAHKRALEEIQRQKAQIRAVIDGMPGLVSYVDRDYRHRFVSARYEKWLGRKVEECEGQPLADVLWSGAMRELKPHLEKAFRGESVSFERRLECLDRVRDVRTTYVPQRNSAGAIEGVIALVQDITEQKQAEEARRESESQFRRIVELASEGIWMVDAEGLTTFVNRRMTEMLGYSSEEMSGRHCLDFIHPEDNERGHTGMARRLEGDSRPREYRFVRKDGATVWLDFTATTISDAKGELSGVLAMCTDITERKLAQEQLQQTQKLESLGVLAGGIAHDFNNLLVGILGNASLAADLVPVSSPAQPMLAGIVSAGERAAKLTRQLLAYAGRDRRQTAAISLDALVSDIVPLLHASIPRTVTLRLDLAGDLPLVEGDEGQLTQILMNLVINAAESVPTGQPGRVTVTTESREPTPAEKQRAVIPLSDAEGPYVVLSVRDTGSGMDAVTVARIFDPFYTTKFAGRGLGLSAVLGIIKTHSGTLIIESTPGEGSVFRVFFRATAKTAAPVVSVSPPPEQGSGTILVVDDEPAVRALATQALQRSGYQVITADDGAEAIEVAANHPEIDLVLLDLAMPHMPGDKAAPEIRKVRPGVRILLSSGCGEREARERFADIGVDGFLQKPYSVQTLLEELRKALPAR